MRFVGVFDLHVGVPDFQFSVPSDWSEIRGVW